MSETTANLALPHILPSQAQKHVTHNEALLRLDALVQLSVISRNLTAPPSSPADGDRYIPATGSTGAWAGWDNSVAVREDGLWVKYVPNAGWLCFVEGEGLVIHTGSTWVTLSSTIAALQNLSLIGIGTVADAANPFSAKLNKALWTARTASEGGDGDLRYTMVKEAGSDVLSLLMQTNYSGRAELGLIGDDNVTLKVSPNGSSWTTALIVDKTSGLAQLPVGLAFTPTGGIAATTVAGALAEVDSEKLAKASNLSDLASVATARLNLSASWGLVLPETRALINVMTTEPRRARTLLIDTLITAMIDAGVWAKMDFLYVMAASNAQAAGLNWKNPGANALTVNNAPIFTADRGYTGTGTASLTPGISWNALTQYTLNSAHVGAWEISSITAGSAIVGGGASSNARLVPRDGSGMLTGRINDGTDLAGAAVAVATGHTVLNRSGASAREAYKDGVSVGSDATASTAIPSTSVSVLRNNSATTTRQVAVAHVGSSLTSTEVLALRTALYTYLHDSTVGAA